MIPLHVKKKSHNVAYLDRELQTNNVKSLRPVELVFLRMGYLFIQQPLVSYEMIHKQTTPNRFSRMCLCTWVCMCVCRIIEQKDHKLARRHVRVRRTKEGMI